MLEVRISEDNAAVKRFIGGEVRVDDADVVDLTKVLVVVDSTAIDVRVGVEDCVYDTQCGCAGADHTPTF